VSILIVTEQLIVPTSKAIVTAITVIVLCVPPVRIVYKCQYRLTVTEQLTVPTSKAIVTVTHTHLCFCQHLYVFSAMTACSTGPHPRCQGQETSSSNQLLCVQSRCCVVSPSYKSVILSDNYRPQLTVRPFTILS